MKNFEVKKLANPGGQIQIGPLVTFLYNKSFLPFSVATLKVFIMYLESPYKFFKKDEVFLLIIKKEYFTSRLKNHDI